MSVENVTDQSLLNEDPNISTVAEDPKCKRPSGLALALIIVSVVAFVVVVIGLSVGLTRKKVRSTSNNELPIKSIAFIAAMEEELTALLDALAPNSDGSISNVIEEKVNISIIQYKGIKIIAALCGIGKVNAAFSTAIILVKYHPDVVINVGVAGGFNKNQTILDFAIANSFVHTDVDITNLGLPAGQILGEPLYFPASENFTNMIRSLESEMNHIFADEFPDIPRKTVDFHYGILGSSDQFIYRDDQVENIKKKFEDVICVEMEGASIAHVCYKFEIPIIAIRSLSDIAVSEGDNTDNYTNSVEIASKSAALLSILLIEKIAREQ